MNTGYPKPDVEKIKPPKWTDENTAETGRVVTALSQAHECLVRATGDTFVTTAMRAAINRLRQLDPKC